MDTSDGSRRGLFAEDVDEGARGRAFVLADEFIKDAFIRDGGELSPGFGAAAGDLQRIRGNGLNLIAEALTKPSFMAPCR